MAASAGAIVSVVLANVIRVWVSPETAIMTRGVLFGVSWIAAISWAVSVRHRLALTWIGLLLAAGTLTVICQHFAGGISGKMMLQLIGPAGAGIGSALLLKRMLQGNRAIWAAGAAALFGCAAALWLALEPGHELWKLLPNNWELSKNLDYRWGIRMGQERARFLFDTSMEAGVVQWFAGAMCISVAMNAAATRLTQGLLGVAALLLFGSVALTYSRAGLVLGAFSIGLTILMSIKSRRATIAACACGLGVLLVAALVVKRLAADEGPAVKNVASILDPNEEANRIRIEQFMRAGNDLAEAPWRGRGATTFVTFQDAPRMPEHESSPVGLITAFGLGGCALVMVFAWAFFSRWRLLSEVIVNKTVATSDTFGGFVAISAPPFALYSLVAPILAGLTFGMICFTIMGLLAIWDAPLEGGSGKP